MNESVSNQTRRGQSSSFGHMGEIRRHTDSPLTGKVPSLMPTSDQCYEATPESAVGTCKIKSSVSLYCGHTYGVHDYTKTTSQFLSHRQKNTTISKPPQSGYVADIHTHSMANTEIRILCDVSVSVELAY